MENLLTVILHLPALILLWGTLMLIFYVKKGITIHVLVTLSIVGFLFCVTNAVAVNPYSSPHSIVFTAMISQFANPLAMALILCLLWSFNHEGRPLPWHQYLWFIVPVALSSVCIMLYCVMGSEEAARCQELTDQHRQFPKEYAGERSFLFFHFIRTYISQVILLIYATVAIVWGLVTLHHTGFTRSALTGFLFHGASLPPMHIQIFTFVQLLFCILLRCALGRYFFIDHIWVNVFFAFLLAFCNILLALASLSFEFEECTMRQFWFLDPREDLSNEQLMEDASADELAEGQPDMAESLFGANLDMDALSEVEARIAKGLHDMMDEGHAYLDNSLHIEQVARALGTNRYYLSRYINENYHVNYNEYINRMRLEYAKNLMLQNPDMLLDVVAADCGFGTAQAFARKFKAMEGITPRTWLVQHQ